jgi:acetyltransferase-like isoleucine patch superfamily enzyme
MKAAKSIPYYVPHKNIGQQIKKSSERRELSPLLFLVKKIRNYLFQILAYNCPVNSVRIWLHRKRGVHIGKHVMLGMHCILDNAHPEYIYIEDYAALAGNNYVIAHSNPYLHFKGRMLSYLAPVIVRKGAWVGVCATLLPGTEIGECSMVSAGSTASGLIPPHCIVTGNPAKISREFSKNEEIFSCYK